MRSNLWIGGGGGASRSVVSALATPLLLFFLIIPPTLTQQLTEEQCQDKWEGCVKKLTDFAGVNSTCDGIIYTKWNCSRRSGKIDLFSFPGAFKFPKLTLPKQLISGRGFERMQVNQTVFNISTDIESVEMHNRPKTRPGWVPETYNWSGPDGGQKNNPTPPPTTTTQPDHPPHHHNNKSHHHQPHHLMLHHEPLVPVTGWVEWTDSSSTTTTDKSVKTLTDLIKSEEDPPLQQTINGSTTKNPADVPITYRPIIFQTIAPIEPIVDSDESVEDVMIKTTTTPTSSGSLTNSEEEQ